MKNKERRSRRRGPAQDTRALVNHHHHHSPFSPQVKPELAVVSKSDGTTGSLARSGYAAACEAAINEQIK